MMRSRFLVAVSLLAVSLSWFGSPDASAQVPPEAYLVDTLAGSDPIGDGGPATEALFNFPSGVAMAPNGDLFVSDRQNSLIRRIAPDGIISTFAGSLDFGTVNDGTEATAGRLLEVFLIDFGPNGDLYIAESSRSRILRIDPQGIVHAVAGQRNSFSYSGDGGPATEAELNRPRGVTVGADGRVYIADTRNYRVRRINLDGTIETIAGTGESGYSGDGGPATEAQLSAVEGVAVAPDGGVYIADVTNNRVRRIAADGTIDTYAGNGNYGYDGDGGPATDARLASPQDVELAPDGTLYVSSYLQVRSISPEGIITTIANTGRKNESSGDGGPAVDAALMGPAGLELEGNMLYVVDTQAHRLRRINLDDGTISAVAGSPHYAGDGGPAKEAQLFRPIGVTADNAGNVYIADTANRVVRKVTPGGVISTLIGTGDFGSPGEGPAAEQRLSNPRGVAVGPDGRVYISDSSSRSVYRIEFDETVSTVAGGGDDSESDGIAGTDAELVYPDGIFVNAAGDLFIAELIGQRVRKVSSAGIITTVAGTGERGFSGDGGPAVEAQLSSPSDVFGDSAGNLYVADSFNGRLRRVTPDGNINTVVDIVGTLSSAAIDPNGNFVIINSNNSHVEFHTPDGSRSNRNQPGAGFAGDGEASDKAAYRSPERVAMAPDGRVLISDYDNHRIRMLVPVPILPVEGILHGASFSGGPFAPASIVTAFGWNLANVFAIAGADLPSDFAGARVTLTDSGGAELPVRNFFATGTQRNMYFPESAAPGPATLTITNIHGRSASANINLAAVSPGLFTMNTSGQGVVAGGALRVDAGENRSGVEIFEYNAAEARFDAVPIDLGGEGDQILLTLYGTGIRGRSDLANVMATIGGIAVPVQYAGEQGEFVGLDQVNLGPIPRELAGQGEVQIVLMVDGVPTNTVTISIL